MKKLIKRIFTLKQPETPQELLLAMVHSLSLSAFVLALFVLILELLILYK
ncbi:hypothetical protein [Flagellimonas sp. 2504JD4-2]